MMSSHLDDEALSAALDAEATAEEQAHLDDCVTCRERVDRLRAIARAVGAQVTVRPAGEVEAAIQAAMATADGRELDSRPVRSELMGGARSRVLAAAAVIVVLLGVGGLLRLVGRSSSSANRTSSVAAQAPTTPNAAASKSAAASPTTAASPAPAVGPMQGPDLGVQTDPAALARLVNNQIGARFNANNGKVANPLAGSTAPALATGDVQAGVPCAVQAATASGLAGQQPVLAYEAPVTWRGQQALVLVYNRSGGGRAGVVMATPSCAVLVVLPL